MDGAAFASAVEGAIADDNRASYDDGFLRVNMIAKYVSQHAEEAAFLWTLRRSIVRRADYTLQDLVAFDDRIEAHLDGLRIAEEGGWQLCREQADQGEPGAVFVLAVLAFESEKAERQREALARGTATAESAYELACGLGWIPASQAETHVNNLLKEPSVHGRYAGMEACSVHRMDPGQMLQHALRDSDALLRASALRLAGELGRRDLRDSLNSAMLDVDETCRFWAAWAATVLGSDQAVPTLIAIAKSESEFREAAAALAVRGMKATAAQNWLRELMEDPQRRRLALVGAGAYGDPALIPWILEQIDDPEHARAAGAALSMITGADLVDEMLEAEMPERLQAGPNDDPDDEDTAVDPDEALPWPSRELSEKWMKRNGGSFPAGVRLLCGMPITASNLSRVLEEGFQRQREAASIELRKRRAGGPVQHVSAKRFQRNI